MIGKAKSISHTAASVDYARKLNEVDDRKGIIIDRNLVAGDFGKEVMSEFKIFQALNGRCERNTLSMIISPFPEDAAKLSNDQFKILSNEVLERLGLSSHQSITVKHPHDTHNHLHVYVNRINSDGKAYKDNYISKEMQRVCDCVAIDFNLTRAKECNQINKILQHTIKTQINNIFKDVLSKPDVTKENLFPRLEKAGLKIKKEINKNKKLTGYTVELFGYKFKDSSLNKDFRAYRLENHIESHETKINGVQFSLNDYIKRSFSLALADKNVKTPDQFFNRIEKMGIKIEPSINKQGDIQGYRVKYKEDSFKASEIGNQYRYSQIEETIHKARSEKFISLYNKPFKVLSNKEQLHTLIVNVIRGHKTNADNFIDKLELEGISISPVCRNKSNNPLFKNVFNDELSNLGTEIIDYKIQYQGKETLATDALLKYVFDHPERVISEAQNIHKQEELFNTKLHIREELNLIFQGALLENPSNQKELFDLVEKKGIQIELNGTDNYLTCYRDEKIAINEVNETFNFQNLDNTINNYQTLDYDDRPSWIGEASDITISNTISESNSIEQEIHSETVPSDLHIDTGFLHASYHPRNDCDEDEEEFKKKKRRRKFNRDNNLNP